MNVTLYLPDSERQTFQTAKRIAQINGTNVSEIFLGRLQTYVADNSELLATVEKATRLQSRRKQRTS
jgi:hypothetical protein